MRVWNFIASQSTLAEIYVRSSLWSHLYQVDMLGSHMLDLSTCYDGQFNFLGFKMTNSIAPMDRWGI